jgi:TRAP transporter TAXI family solute receptor
MHHRSRTRRDALGLLSGAAIFSALVGSARAATRYIVIGTGGTGGVFYPYGGGLAQLLSKKLPDTQATAEVTGGSVDNIKLLGSGNAELGLATVDSAYDGFKGEAAYKDAGPQAIATLAVLYPSYLHVVASRSSGIAKIADIKGKRASVGSAGSSTESICDRVLAAAGVDPVQDVTRDNLGISESAGALKDGKIDVFFWIGGLPTPAVKDLASTNGADIVFINTGELAGALAQKYPGVYQPAKIPQSTYQGLEADVPVLGVDNVLLSAQSLDGGFVKEILSAIFDNLDTVHSIHPTAKSLALKSAARATAVPFHPAAVEFYKSRGAMN